MEVWAAIAEFPFDGTEIQLFKNKQDAIHQLYQWVGAEVIELKSDYEKSKDKDILNFIIQLVTQIKIERDQANDVHWIYEEDSDTVYRIEKLSIN